MKRKRRVSDSYKGILTEAQLAKIEFGWVVNIGKRQSTHWEECYLSHCDCAINLLLANLHQARELLRRWKAEMKSVEDASKISFQLEEDTDSYLRASIAEKK